MNFDSIANKFVGGLILIAALTTVFGRKNTPAVFNSLGNAGGNLISKSLGAGAGIS